MNAPSRLFRTPQPSETGAPVEVIADRDPNAAARRVAIDEKTQEALEAAVNQDAADMRDAAILNTLLLAKQHAQSHEITAEDVARWRRIRAEIDATATAEGERVPTGFGPAVRTAHAVQLVRTVAKFGANVETKSVEG